MRNDFSTSFTRDMSPQLADHYLTWLPFGREAIAQTVMEFSSPERLSDLIGVSPDSYEMELIRAAWVAPWHPYLQRTGKMLRPYLVSLCIEAYGRNPKDYYREVALAELIHTSSLILDDIADDSMFRRGGPTAHQEFGVIVAGAAGSAWLNLGFEVLWQDQDLLGSETAQRVMDEIAWEHFVTGLGTTLDVTWPWLAGPHTPEQYLQQIAHRSASYSYRMPLKIGGLVAGASESQVEKLSAFGQQVGLAFQIIDDVLNVKPSDPHWGKAVAEDVTQGKITLQVILALERADDQNRRRLVEILESHATDEATLAQAVAILDDTGALDECRGIASRMQTEAVTLLYSLDIQETHRRLLNDLADYILRRTR